MLSRAERVKYGTNEMWVVMSRCQDGGDEMLSLACDCYFQSSVAAQRSLSFRAVVNSTPVGASDSSLALDYCARHIQVFVCRRNVEQHVIGFTIKRLLCSTFTAAISATVRRRRYAANIYTYYY